MRIWRHFAVLATFVSLPFATALGQTAPAKPSQSTPQSTSQSATQNDARVRHVLVHGTGAAMEVEIQTSGAPVEPDTQAITGPDRIVVDFPGALPADELRALKVNRGALKAIRSGLFFSNPPITRIVLDLTEPQSYQISTSKISATENSVIIKLAPGKAAAASQIAAQSSGQKKLSGSGPASPARLQNATLSTGTRTTSVRSADIVTSSSNHSAISNPAVATATPAAAVEPPAPPKPAVTVTYENGMLSIHSNRATLAQVLFEVHLRTHAEIAIPSGAEQEEVFVDLGPGSARDVLASLLNGSPYNFIFVGDEAKLEQVILSRRDPSIF
jgi:hypothetical protein